MYTEEMKISEPSSENCNNVKFEDLSKKIRRETLIDEAKRIILSDRNKEYGEPEDVFATIGDYWTTYIQRAYDTDTVAFTDQDVAVMMALMKIARISANPDCVDSWVDAIGYLAIGGSF